MNDDEIVSIFYPMNTCSQNERLIAISVGRAIEMRARQAALSAGCVELDEAKGILRLFYEACNAVDPDTGPYLDTNMLHRADDALREKGLDYLRGSDGKWAKTPF